VTILEDILAHKREELERARAAVPDAVMAERAAAAPHAVRSLYDALAAAPPPRVIAEIKRRSPSRGPIRPDLDPLDCAKAYAAAGAAALSVLTDARFFGGSLDDLCRVRAAVELPLLRKDFVLDARQVDEARWAGADAVLLIVAALPAERLAALLAHAAARGLDALVEVHDADELETARAAGARLVGINNRDLRSFEVDLGTTEALAPRAGAGRLVVTESGIHGPADLRRLAAAGAGAFLVGESLMREPDPGAALRRLREGG